MSSFFDRLFRRFLRKNTVSKDREEIVFGEMIKLLRKPLLELGFKFSNDEIRRNINIPKRTDKGDYTFPCSALAKKISYTPHEFAMSLRTKMGSPSETYFDSVEVAEGNVCFFINRKSFAREVLWDVIYQRDGYGKGNEGKNHLILGSKKVVLDFSHLTIGKSPGMNHLLAIASGNSLSEIYRFRGFTPIKINYFRTGWLNLARLVSGFEKFGNEEELEKMPMEQLGEIYKKTKNYKLEQKLDLIRSMQIRDRKSIMLWRAFRELSIESFDDFNKTFGVKFDEYSGELESLGRVFVFVRKLQELGLLTESNGSLGVNLKKYGLGFCEIKGRNGILNENALEISEAIRRYGKYKFAKMIYGVDENEVPLKQVFKILELMGYEWARNCFVVKYGFYSAKNGRRLSGNENNVSAKEVFKKLISFVGGKKVSENSFLFVRNSVFYKSLEKDDSGKVTFDVHSLFSGSSSFLHIKKTYDEASILVKDAPESDEFIVHDLDEAEFELVKKISRLNKVSLDACAKMNPSIIYEYCCDITNTFDKFRNSCEIYDAEKKSFRIALVESFRQVLRNSMNLIGIKINQ